MQNNKQTITWVVRILIAILFLLSGIAKAFTSWSALFDLKPSAWIFEKQLVDLGITGWCASHYLARFIIALEIAIGLALLQGNYLRSIVIPGTMLLLLLFNVHLGIQMYQFGPMNGNCGCFGQLIPMTPLEAFIKNVITIAFLVYLFIKVRDKEKGQNSFVYPLALFFGALAAMFIIAPFCPCVDKKAKAAHETTNFVGMPSTTVDTSFVLDPLPNTTSDVIPVLQGAMDTLKKDDTIKLKKARSTSMPPTNKVITDTSKKAVVKLTGPASVKSKFATFTQFNGNAANLDIGKKIVCMFNPNCDHCRATTKKLAALSESNLCPPIYIIFLDEEPEKIPDFFNEAGKIFPYTLLDIQSFWETMGIGVSLPSVSYMDNGNLIKFYHGIEKEEYNDLELRTILGIK